MLLEIGNASDAWGIPETSALLPALLPLQHGGSRAKDSGMHLRRLSCEGVNMKESVRTPWFQ